MGIILVLLYLAVPAKATYTVASDNHCDYINKAAITTAEDCFKAFIYFHGADDAGADGGEGAGADGGEGAGADGGEGAGADGGEGAGADGGRRRFLEHTTIATSAFSISSANEESISASSLIRASTTDDPPGCFYKINNPGPDRLIFNSDQTSSKPYSETFLGLCAEPSGGASSCNAGQYHDDNTKDCQECPVGQSSSASATSCVTCTLGKYNDQTQQASCKDCPVGTINNDDGAVVGNHDQESDCQECLAGQSSSAAASACITCTRGKYNDQSKASCKDCPVGKKLTSGQGIITQHDQADDCVVCPAGKYNDKKGWYEECPLCANGDQTLQGRTTCDSTNDDGTVSCSPGKFSQAEQCVDCSVGKYNDVQDGACKECELGFYNDEERQTEW